MSVSRPARWFLGALEAPHCRTLPRARQFHTSTCLYERREKGYGTKGQANQKPTRYDEVLYGKFAGQSRRGRDVPRTRLLGRKRSAEVGRDIAKRAEGIPSYTPEQIEALSKVYTPQQVQAILAAEQAIDPEDLIEQSRMRNDPAKLPYLDDLSSIDPVLDKLRQGPEIRHGISTQGWHGESGADGDADKGDRARRSPKKDAGKKLTAAEQRLAERDEDPRLLRLMQQTGYTAQQIAGLRVKTLVTRRVSNMTRLGKVGTLYFLTAAGNGNGLLGIGEGKSAEASDAQRQAMMAAIRNMKPVHRYENRTIYGDVVAKVGAAVVELNSRAPGFGVRTQHLIFEMARMAGITDLAGKCLRSKNPMNVCKATFNALLSQRLPEDVARARGLKLVDVRKVYYAGRTL